LGLLKDGRPQHGYALMKSYQLRSGLRISTANFYREFQRLVAEGLVRTAANPPGADVRRSPYEITDEGREAFRVWIDSGAGNGFGNYEDEISARALFLTDIEPAVSTRQLNRWEEELWIKTKVLEREREEALSINPSSAEGDVLALLISRRLAHIAADLDFVRSYRKAREAWIPAARDDTASPGARGQRAQRASPTRPNRRQ
jgi:DNA-binding PadR family transcriptional regulator